ncbi:MAG: HipA domain-containing protein [Oscillospiraceae bacterium]|nr:HipA domain-containing protein [Oscillospiraceae bacterium]
MAMKDFEILSKNTVVALWRNKELSVVRGDLLPLFLRRVHDAEMWLESRAIDSHRANSRLLKKALRLTEKDDISTVIHVNAATITDTYWVRPLGSDLQYEDIRFHDDYFANLALRGTYDSFNKAANSKRSRTPELTNIGSFEKCWKLKDGKWWMYKKANHNELFSELFAAELGKALGFDMALYERGKGYVMSRDFTDGARVNFEPASSFMGDDENYEATVKVLQKLCPAAVPNYVRMIFLDTIIANPDRHTNNYGVLRDADSGEITGFAPNFDNNMALIARGYPKMPTQNDLLIRLFNDLLSEHPEFKELIPTVNEDIIRDVLSNINMKVRSQDIIDFILKRYELIEK